jgi:hypothetical protein
MASPSTFSDELMILNNEGVALLEAQTYRDTLGALDAFSRALVSAEDLLSLPFTIRPVDVSTVAIRDLCEGVKMPICAETYSGLHFHNDALKLKTDVWETLGTAGVHLSVFVVLNNIALSSYQLGILSSQTQQTPEMRRRTHAHFLKARAFYWYALLTIRGHEATQTPPSKALVLLGLAAQNNLALIELKMGSLHESAENYRQLLETIFAMDRTSLAVADQADIQEFVLNTVVLSLMGFFTWQAAAAA